MRIRYAATSAGLAMALLAGPVAALAQGVAADAADAVVVDRADFYDPLPEEGAVTLLSSSRTLVQITDEMKYFTKYESHGNYDQGFSSGDGYNALGYYQFDRRYSLIPFLRYCLSYDAGKYAMLAPVVERASEVADGSVPMYEDGEPTELGALVEDAWHAAYEADPDEFSLLQDNYAYNNYYLLSERYLASMGVDMTSRADCVKGLVWSMTNLFGSGGVRWFLDAAGLSDDMTDREFVNALVDAVVDNIAERYPSQPQYHEGWIRRYESERAECLDLISPYDDLEASDWYYDSVMWSYERGLMGGYGGTASFGPLDSLWREQAAQILYNALGKGSDAPACGLADVEQGAWYADAVNWAYATGLITGYGDGSDDFGVGDPLTREQLAAILARVAGADLTSVSASVLDRFADAGDASDWAVPALSWAVSEGVLGGSVASDGTLRLRPGVDINRAEMATMLSNAATAGALPVS